MTVCTKPLHHRILDDRRGSAAIEFGIVINVFVALVVSIFSIGYGMSIRSDLTRSLMAAERHALIFDEDDTALKDVMKAELSKYDTDSVGMQLTRSTNGGVTYVRAKLTYKIDMEFGLGIGPIELEVDRTFPT